MTAPALHTADPVDAVVLRHLTWEQERTTIAPITVAGACRTYSARLVRMTDEQLAVERHRLEGLLPHGQFHHLADEEFEIRRAVAHDVETAHAELLAAMAPPTLYSATGGTR